MSKLFNLNLWISILLSIVIIVLLLFIVIYLFKDKLLYMPSDKEFNIERGKWVKFGPELSGYLTQNRNNHIIIYSHGNGGNVTWYSSVISKLSERSDVFAYDYPGYGRSSGKPNEANVMESGLHAYDYLKSLGYKNIWCYGFSLGGSVTTNICSKRDVKGAVLQSTFYNMSDCIPILSELIAGKDFSSDNISGISCPVVVSHSKKDSVVPYSSGRKLYDSLNCEKYFYELNNDHNYPPDKNEYYDYIFNTVFVV